MIPDDPRTDGWTVSHEEVVTPVGRWRLVEATPPPALAELVETVWASQGHDCFEEEEILPRSSTEVLFGLGDRHSLRDRREPSRQRHFDASFVSGLQQEPLHVISPPTTAMAGVRLHPAGVATFLRDTPAAIAGAVVELDAILGPQVERLRQRVATTPDLRDRALLLAAAVGRRLAAARPLAEPVRHVLWALQASGGTTPIRHLVRETGYSHRWVTRRFRDAVGLTPKAFARLVRFESAFARLNTLHRVHWAELALDCGYYDQAHMAREFRAFAGTTPSEVFRRRSPDGLGLLTDDDVPTGGPLLD